MLNVTDFKFIRLATKTYYGDKTMSNHLSILIRAKQLSEDLGISTITLWRWRNQNFIPHPIVLGPRIIAWERSVINTWLEEKRVNGGQQ